MPIAHHSYLLAPGASEAEIRAFYSGALGLTERPRPESLSHIPVVWFWAGSFTLHIGHPPQGIVGGGHTALATDDVDALLQRLRAHGSPVDDDVIPMGYPRFYTRDPWGNQFEILPDIIP